MSNLYRVVVTGKQLIDDSNEVRRRITEIFDLSATKLDQLLKGRAVVIKKNIDASSALKYKKALSSCGLEVLVEPMNEDSIIDADELHNQSEAPAPAPLSTLQSEIKLAAPGARIGPRPSIARHPLPSIDHLSADRSERLAPLASQGPKPPSVGHIKMAEVGADIGQPVIQESLDLDLDHIHIAPVGESLIEATQVAPLVIDTTNITLDDEQES